MNGKVTWMRPDLATVSDVAHAVLQDVDKIDEVYVVAMIDGTPTFYLSGDIKGSVFAAAVLQDYACQLLKEPAE
jgi:hypothetical protein